MTTSKFDRDSVTSDSIRSLRIDAGQHGDSQLVSLCDAALEGDASAIKRCIDFLESAWNLAQ